jgi:hypothetical protein
MFSPRIAGRVSPPQTEFPQIFDFPVSYYRGALAKSQLLQKMGFSCGLRPLFAAFD